MSKKLLLVEESATMRKAISLCFARTEIEVVEVKSLSEAVERAQAEHPDVIAIDVVAGDGYEVCGQIKATAGLESVAVLLMGGISKPIDEAKAVACGANDAMQKPVESQILLEKIFALAGLPAPEPLPGVIVRRPHGTSAPAPAPVAPAPVAVVPPAPEPAPVAPVMAPPPVAPVAPPVARPPMAPMTNAPRPAMPGVPGRPPMAPMSPVKKMPTRPPMAPMTNAPRPAMPGVSGRPPMAPMGNMPPRPPMPGMPGMRPPVPGAPGGRPPMQMTPQVQEQLIRAAVQRLSREIAERVVWEVVPQLAETLIREKLEQLDLEALVQKASKE